MERCENTPPWLRVRTSGPPSSATQAPCLAALLAGSAGFASRLYMFAFLRPVPEIAQKTQGNTGAALLAAEHTSADVTPLMYGLEQTPPRRWLLSSLPVCSRPTS